MALAGVRVGDRIDVFRDGVRIGTRRVDSKRWASLDTARDPDSVVDDLQSEWLTNGRLKAYPSGRYHAELVPSETLGRYSYTRDRAKP